MASIRKRYGKFYVAIRKKGYDSICATFDDEETAKKWADQTERNINLERAYSKTEKITSKLNLFSDLVPRYVEEHLSKKSDGKHRASQLTFWLEEFEGVFIEDITPEMIKNSLSNLAKKISKTKKKILSPATIKRYHACLSHFFTIAMVEWKIIKNHPCQMLFGGNRIGVFSQKKHEWISVKDRLPDPDLIVLACDNNTMLCEVCCYNESNEGFKWETSLAQLIEFKPTHWKEIELPNYLEGE